MTTTLGWVAVMAGLAGGPMNRTDGPEITYQFKSIEVRGLQWREGGVPGLKAVASRGGVTVWTAPKDFIKKLPAGSVKEDLTAPKVTTRAQTAAHVTSRKGHSYVTQVAWRGEDTSPRKTSDTIREGMAATVSGRAMDQGVLTQLVIEDTEVRAVHTVNYPVPTAPKDARVARASTKSTSEEDAPPCCGAGKVPVAGCNAETSTFAWQSGFVEICLVAKTTDCSEATTAAKVEIPEVGRADIAGEWLIPKDEILLVAFGPHTIADKDGKAVVREHIAMITAEEVATNEDRDAEPLGFPVLPTAARPAHPVSAVTPAAAPPHPALPMPATPSRTLPQGVNADGTPAALPKLPDEDTTPAPEGSSEPAASPQSRKTKGSK